MLFQDQIKESLFHYPENIFFRFKRFIRLIYNACFYQNSISLDLIYFFIILSFHHLQIKVILRLRKKLANILENCFRDFLWPILNG